MSSPGQTLQASVDLEEMKRLRETREKAWKDSTDSEKIEKLKMFVEMFNYMSTRIGELQAEVFRLKSHSHGENGAVLIPIQSANANGLGGSVGSHNPLN